jgi:hypothetical protein
VEPALIVFGHPAARPPTLRLEFQASSLCRKPIDERPRMRGRTAIDDGIDYGDPNGATEIAHHIEQAARIGNRTFFQLPERQLRRR